jgi:hypothetical protein
MIMNDRLLEEDFSSLSLMAERYDLKVSVDVDEAITS